MKVGIITIFDIANYGNRLQNYAVQTVLNNYHIETVTYACENEIVTPSLKLKYFIHKAGNFKFTGRASFWKGYVSKVISFEKFNKKYITFKRYHDIKEIDCDNDYFVVGSDQVWNPTWYDENENKKYAYLLTFTEKEKKVCFSPSFGVAQLPAEWQEWFKRYLNEFDTISVREDSGAELVKELTGKTATVLIDPTLMLDQEDWNRIVERPDCVESDEEYICLYFLGAIPYSAKARINELNKTMHVKIIDICDKNVAAEKFGGPGGFVYLISHAKLVLTDSFHACVFSFLYETPFLVYERQGENVSNMMSRIETLLNTFSLQNRLAAKCPEQEVFCSDYSQGKKQLITERKKVADFLKQAMKMQ